MTAALPWLTQFAAARGLRYEPDADERWIRAWEPFATLRSPMGYEQALHTTGTSGFTTSIARMLVPGTYVAPTGEVRRGHLGSWVVLAQDSRMRARVAATSDTGGHFGEPLEQVSLRRGRTGDPAFDAAFASFAEEPSCVPEIVSPSLRQLLLNWRLPLHFELRPGGFVLAPVGLGCDSESLDWLIEAVALFSEKATKLVR